MDRYAACPASAVQSAGCPSSGSDDTALGNALDYGLQLACEGNPWDAPSLLATFASDADPDELKEAIVWGMVWLCTNYPGAKAQDKLKTGTVDFSRVEYDEVTLEPKAVHIIDCKKTEIGGEEPDNRMQLVTYFVEKAELEGVDRGSATVLYPYQKRAATVEFGPEQFAIAKSMVDKIRAEATAQFELPVDRRSYRVTDLCRYCPGASTCPAIASQSRGVVQMLAAVAEPGFVLERDRLPTAYNIVKRFQSAAEDFLKMTKEIISTGGPVEDASGKLSTFMQNNPRTPSYKRAMETLRELGHSDIADLVDSRVQASLAPVTQSPRFKFTVKKEPKK